jgi:hypothetical protein
MPDGETNKMERRITIDPITRLEGHGKIEIFLGACLRIELKGVRV